MASKKKLLIFSHCYLYGGSERLMKSIYNNPYIEQEYDILFSYYQFKAYDIGLKKDNGGILSSEKFLPLMVMDHYSFFDKVDNRVKNKYFRYAVKVPLYLLKKTGLYSLWNFILFYFLIKKIKPDVVHINNGGYPAASGCNDLTMVLKLFPNIKTIYQVNNIARQTASVWKKWWDKKIYSRVDMFLMHSKAARNALVQRGFPENKIHTMPSFFEEKLDLDINIRKEFNLTKDKTLLVTVGFLEHRKGQYFLVQAVAKLKEKFPSLFERIHLILVGNGIDKQKLETFIKKNSLTETITLAGYRTDSHQFINEADIFVLPSVAHEDMPLVMLTAMQYNKLIVASKFAGIADLLTDELDAMLVSPDTETIVDELVEKIVHLMQDKYIVFNLKKNLKVCYKQKLGKEKYANELLGLYKAVH